MKVKITCTKTQGAKSDLVYKIFDYDHSQLWINGIKNFISSNGELSDNNRVYNFDTYESEIKNLLKKCNDVINQLNKEYTIVIPFISLDNLQEDINFVHTFFVDSDREKESNPLWSELNSHLHGLEIVQRSRNKKKQGQIFCSFPNLVKYEIPENSFHHFTTRKNYGYCYANYPHVGRHVLEMFNAQDHEAHAEHILPQSMISGDFYLWFGNNTPIIYDVYRMWKIKKWFNEEKIYLKVNMRWGDPKLAIGWLPVAKLENFIPWKELQGINCVSKIDLIE
jgi:hypothetical protein